MRNTLKFAAAVLLLAGCSSGGVSGDGSVSGAVKLGSAPAPAGTVVVLTGWSSGSAQTDASGKYTFSKLHDGDYAVLVELPSTVEQRQVVQVTVAKGGATSAPDLTFTGLGSVSGTVQLGSSPAVGVPVTADGAGVALTDSAGHFSLQNVPVGAHTVSAAIPGGARASAQVTVAYKQDVTTTLTLGASGSISGTVQIAGLTDASGVGVDLVGPRSGSATTDASGAFKFDNLPDGHYLLMAHGSGLWPASASASADVTNGQGPSALSLAFSPVGTVAGVVTLDGAPAPGAVVMVQGTNLAASTGADGSYTLAGVPVGVQTLTVALSGAIPATAQVTVTRGQSAAGNVELVPVTGPATLKGAATVVGGAPASGGTVALGAGAAQPIDGNGGYLLPGLDSQLSPLTLHGADPLYQETIPMVLALPGTDGQYLGGGTVQPLGPIELQRGVRAVSGSCVQVNNLAPDGAEALVATQGGQCYLGGYGASANRVYPGAAGSGAEYRVLADGGTFPLANGAQIPASANYAPNSDQVVYAYPSADGLSVLLHESLLDGTDVELSSQLRSGDYSYWFTPDGKKVAFWTDPTGVNNTSHVHLMLADVATGTPLEIASDVVEGQLWFAANRLLWEQIDASGKYSTWTAANDGSGKHQVLASQISADGAFYLDPDGAFAVYRDATSGHLMATTLDNPSPQDLTPCDDFQVLAGGTLVLWRNDVSPAVVQVASLTLGSTGLTFAAQTALTLPLQTAANRSSAMLTFDDGMDLAVIYRQAGDRVAIGANGTFAALASVGTSIGAVQFLSGTRTAVTTLINSPPPDESLVLDTFATSLTPTSRTDIASQVISFGRNGKLLYVDSSSHVQFDDVVNQTAPLQLPADPASARLSDDGLHVFYSSGGGNTPELMEVTPPSTSPVDLGTEASGSYSLYFSPDGSKLAYVLDEYDPAGPTVRVATADGSNVQVAAHAACPVGFSYDGSALAVGSHFNNGTFNQPATRETDLYDVASGTLTPVLGQVPSYFDGCSSVEQPTWLQSAAIIDPRLMFPSQEYQFQSGAYVLPKP